MEIEDQIVSLELAKKLKALGIRQYSFFFWRKSHYDKDVLAWRVALYPAMLKDFHKCSAFTVSELAAMLPCDKMFWNIAKRDYIENTPDDYVVSVAKGTSKFAGIINTFDVKLSDAMAKMIIKLLDKNLLDDEWKSKWIKTTKS